MCVCVRACVCVSCGVAFLGEMAALQKRVLQDIKLLSKCCEMAIKWQRPVARTCMERASLMCGVWSDVLTFSCCEVKRPIVCTPAVCMRSSWAHTCVRVVVWWLCARNADTYCNQYIGSQRFRTQACAHAYIRLNAVIRTILASTFNSSTATSTFNNNTMLRASVSYHRSCAPLETLLHVPDQIRQGQGLPFLLGFISPLRLVVKEV